MTSAYEKWVSEVFPVIKVKFAAVAAKSRWFIDEKGNRVESGNEDQSMFAHVFNTVSSIHQIVESVGLKDHGLTDDDEFLAYAAATMHDMDKFSKGGTGGRSTGVMNGMEDMVIFAEWCNIKAGAVGGGMQRVKSAIDNHHPKTKFVPDFKHPVESSSFKHDVIYHLLILGDRVASSMTIEEARKNIERTLGELVANVDRFKSVRWHFATHQTGAFDGDLVASLHAKAEEYLAGDGWNPVLYFPDGTVYHSRDAMKAVDVRAARAAIASGINELISGNVVQIVVQKNKVKITTKEFENKASPRKVLSKIASALKVPMLVEKKYKQIVVDLDVMSKEEPVFGTAFGKIGYEPYCHAAFLFLTGVVEIVKGYGFIAKYEKMDFTTRNENLCKMLFGDADPGVVGRMDSMKIVDSKGSAGNPMKTPGHFFPVAKAIRDRVYDAGQSIDVFIDRVHAVVRDALVRVDGDKFNGAGDVMLEKVERIVESGVGFDGYPSPSTDVDYGLSAYTNALDGLPGRFDAKCFLCGSTSDLEEVGPSLVRMALQQQSDRVPSGKGISAGTIKRICTTCMVKNTIRNGKHGWVNKDDAEKTFYITVLPNHVFTRDYDTWFGRYIANMFSIGKEQYKKYVKKIKDDDDDARTLEEKDVKLYPFIVSFLVNDLVSASYEKGEMTNMAEMLHGALERVVDVARFKKELGDDGAEDYTSSKDELVTSLYLQHNGFVIPFKFMDEKVNATSMWFVTGIISMVIGIVTGARVTVTQDYGNIPMIEPRAAVTFDGMSPKAEMVLGNEVELAGGDIVAKFDRAVGIYYLNANTISPDDARENTIPSVISMWKDKPAKLVDLCYRYTEKADLPSTKEFYRLFSVIKAIDWRKGVP